MKLRSGWSGYTGKGWGFGFLEMKFRPGWSGYNRDGLGTIGKDGDFRGD